MKQMIQRDAQGALTTFLQQVKKAPDLMGTLSDLFGMEYADDIAPEDIAKVVSEWTGIPANKLVTIEAVITAIDDRERLLTANGFLIVDGKVIYQMHDFSLRLR